MISWPACTMLPMLFYTDTAYTQELSKTSFHPFKTIIARVCTLQAFVLQLLYCWRVRDCEESVLLLCVKFLHAA